VSGLAQDLGAGTWARELRISGLDEAEVERWRELGRRSVDPNPFLEPDFLLPAQGRVATAPDRLIAIGGAGSWHACVALTSGRWRRLARTWEAGDPTYGFLGTPLIAPEQAEGSAVRLLEAVGAARAYPLVLQRLLASGPFYAALQSAVAGGSIRALELLPYSRAVLLRHDEDPFAHLGRHHARELRRMGRRLAEQLDAELEVVDNAGDEAAVERFLELEKSGWKGKAGTAFASDPAHADFFRELCARFHAQGRLQLYDLCAGGRSVAMKCNLLAGRGSFGFKIAFDESFARFSPGIQLEVANVERFAEGDLEWIDSCANPDNKMINRLWQERRELCTIVLGDQRPRSQAAASSIALARSLRAARSFRDRLREPD
jgi:CelD/BcsL family acetyltransferase involved in cellulose biosynthesis